MKHIKLYEQFLNESSYKPIANMLIVKLLEDPLADTELAKVLIKSQKLKKKKIIIEILKEMSKRFMVPNNISLNKLNYKKYKTQEEWTMSIPTDQIGKSSIGNSNLYVIFNVIIHHRLKSKNAKIKIVSYVSELFDDYYGGVAREEYEEFKGGAPYEYKDEQSVSMDNLDKELKTIYTKAAKKWNNYLKKDFHTDKNIQEVIDDELF
tara:strand:- start:277 stop:897 length:621 start_codon:yes stop_codon:yes gene_type:complete